MWLIIWQIAVMEVKYICHFLMSKITSRRNSTPNFVIKASTNNVDGINSARAVCTG